MYVTSKNDSFCCLSTHDLSTVSDIDKVAMNSVSDLQTNDESINMLGMKILYTAWFNEVFSSDGTNEDLKQEW